MSWLVDNFIGGEKRNRATAAKLTWTGMERSRHDTETARYTNMVDGLEAVRKLDCWCTPSIIKQNRPLDPYLSDASISVEYFGSLHGGNGLIGQAQTNVAKHYGAANCLISVNGSTGSNHMIVRTAATAYPNQPIVLARNCHLSYANGCEMFGVEYAMIEGQRFNERFEALLPPTAKDVASAFRKTPNASMVVITSPTYEGVVADIPAIAKTVHAHGALLVVDQAWAAHFGFHPDVPRCALHDGANIVITSTHKTGGSLQQTGVILFNHDLPAEECLRTAHKQLTTTSPSFLLIASVESAVESLASDTQQIDRVINRTKRLAQLMKMRVPQVETLSSDAVGLEVDPCRAVFSWSAGPSGIELSAAMAEHGIIVEKAGLHTITVIVTFQLAEGAEKRFVDVFAELFDALPSTKHTTDSTVVFSSRNRPFDTKHTNITLLPLVDAVGSVSAEIVSVYPPGIPLFVPGTVITSEAVGYLQEVLRAGGHLAARDLTGETIKVVSALAGETHRAAELIAA